MLRVCFSVVSLIDVGNAFNVTSCRTTHIMILGILLMRATDDQLLIVGLLFQRHHSFL